MQTLSDRSFIESQFRSAISVSDLPDNTKFLQDAEMEIQGYETEIGSLESAILVLKQKKEEVERCMAVSTSLFAPVHRLPAEILQCIFDFACAVTSYEDNWLLSSEERTLAVLTISATCGRWRNIALSTSSLWSGIGLDLDGDITSGRYRGLTSLVRLFLDRSNLSLLTVFLSFGETTIDDGAKPCLTELVQQSHRWQRLYLWNSTREVLTSDLFRPLRENLPNLIELDVTGYRRKGVAIEDLAPFHCDLFEYCPRISTLSFQPGTPLIAAHSLPWQQVRTLQLCRQVSFYAMPVLSLCHNVENLEVFSIGDVDGRPVYQGHQISPSIRRLSILEIVEEDEFSCIFRNTTLPQLSELQIVGEDECGIPSREWKVWQEELVLDFLTRSSCSITTLNLKCVPISDAQLIRLLQRIPSLKSLSLEEYRRSMESTHRIFTPSFFDALLLDVQSSESLFLPRLTDLRFVADVVDLDDQALSKAIISRWNVKSPPTSNTDVHRIKIIDIVLLEKENCIFNRLMDSLHWMSGEGARVTIAEREERRK
ncbi:hypothetical protein VNI00_008747 [Paramarasmius palmivorus]|uniref:F-box domain-containing protein n=1 Tax=Paramarasmius palmivorus TaxID=297713 RepID=A0AAW0CWQ9_9AGAR